MEWDTGLVVTHLKIGYPLPTRCLGFQCLSLKHLLWGDVGPYCGSAAFPDPKCPHPRVPTLPTSSACPLNPTLESRLEMSSHLGGVQAEAQDPDCIQATLLVLPDSSTPRVSASSSPSTFHSPCARWGTAGGLGPRTWC